MHSTREQGHLWQKLQHSTREQGHLWQKSHITTSHHSPCRYIQNTSSAPQETDHEAAHLALSLDGNWTP